MHCSFCKLVPSAGALLFQVALMRIMAKRNLKVRFPLFFHFIGLSACHSVHRLVIGPLLPAQKCTSTRTGFSTHSDGT